LHAPSLVSIGQSKLKLLSGNWISIFSNSELDLDHVHVGSNPKLCLDVRYPYTKFGVNRPKQTKSYLVETEFLFLVTVPLTLITDTWVAIPSCVLMKATHTASLVSIGQSKLSYWAETEFLFLETVTLTLITYTWVAIPSCVLMKATYTASLVSIGQIKLKVLSGNWISILSNSDLDLDHRHMGSKPKLPLDISYPYSKFGVNRPKQT